MHNETGGYAGDSQNIGFSELNELPFFLQSFRLGNLGHLGKYIIQTMQNQLHVFDKILIWRGII